MAFVFLLAGGASAQSIEDQVTQLAQDNGALYLEPLFKGFGLGLTQGAFSTARVHQTLGFDVGAIFSAAIVPDDAMVFDPILPATITYQGTTYQNPYQLSKPTSPTVTGSEPPARVELKQSVATAIRSEGGDPDDYEFDLPEGLDLPAVPFAMLQGTIGLPLGTEVSLRMFPEIELTEEIGSLSAMGFGVRHSISQWIPGSPVDVTGVFSTQSLEVGDIFEAKGTGFGLVVGKTLAGVLDVFVAGTTESSSIDVAYTFENPVEGVSELPPSHEVTYTQDLDAATRFTGGVTVNLLLLKLSAAYSVADYNAFTAKALISFR